MYKTHGFLVSCCFIIIVLSLTNNTEGLVYCAAWLMVAGKPGNTMKLGEEEEEEEEELEEELEEEDLDEFE